MLQSPSLAEEEVCFTASCMPQAASVNLPARPTAGLLALDKMNHCGGLGSLCCDSWSRVATHDLYERMPSSPFVGCWSLSQCSLFLVRMLCTRLHHIKVRWCTSNSSFVKVNCMQLRQGLAGTLLVNLEAQHVWLNTLLHEGLTCPRSVLQS